MRYIDPEAKVLSDAKKASAKIDLTTICKGCGKSFTHKLPWFQKKKFICPDCGGVLDDEPLRKMAVSAAEALRDAIKKKIQAS